MTDQELYDKIKTIIVDHYGDIQDDYFGGSVSADTVAQLIMNEVLDMCHVIRDKAFSSGYDTAWMDLKLQE
jgi:hypothetical protein